MSLGLRQQFEFLRARHESMVDFSLHDVSWCLTDGQLALPPPNGIVSISVMNYPPPSERAISSPPLVFSYFTEKMTLMPLMFDNLASAPELFDNWNWNCYNNNMNCYHSSNGCRCKSKAEPVFNEF